MTARLNYMTLVLVAVLVVAGAFPFGARPQAQNPDTLSALLVEVRGLRAAMEQLASAGPRVQLLFGRLQLQEQRINEQMRRLDSMRATLKEIAERDARYRSEIVRYEDFIRNNPSSNEVPDLQGQLPGLRRALATTSSELLRLQTDEAALLSDIAVEQNRWTEINRTLDELDRALTRR